MTYGTGPQALVNHIESNWQASRTGREDVPPLAKDQPGGIEENQGVVVFKNRDEISTTHSVHDLIHCYHPEASGLSFEDKGYDERGSEENVQVDIELTDRTDTDTEERLYAEERMVGDRESSGFPSDESPPYPGVMGEVIYVLSEVRRGLEEWDVTRIHPLSIHLGNSNASVSLDVILEHIATDTVV